MSPTPDRFDPGLPHPPTTGEMPLLEHLRELRRRLVVSLAVVGVSVVAATFYAPSVWQWLVAPMNDALMAQGKGSMAVLTPLEGVVTYLKVAVLTGFIVASPVVFFQAWRFVAPGLYPREKRFVMPLVVASSTLFLGGVAFGYYFIFPYAFVFFMGVTAGAADAMVSMQSYLELVTWMLLAFGACFQVPVVAWFLGRIGLVDARDLLRWYKYAVVVIFVVAAVITPPDVLSQVLLAIPLLVLYAVSIVVVAFTSTKKRATERSAA